MILVLTQDGTKLQLKLAFLIDSTVSNRYFLVLVEFGVTDQTYALFKIEDAFVEHTKLLKAH